MSETGCTYPITVRPFDLIIHKDRVGVTMWADTTSAPEGRVVKTVLRALSDLRA